MTTCQKDRRPVPELGLLRYWSISSSDRSPGCADFHAWLRPRISAALGCEDFVWASGKGGKGGMGDFLS